MKRFKSLTAVAVLIFFLFGCTARTVNDAETGNALKVSGESVSQEYESTVSQKIDETEPASAEDKNEKTSSASANKTTSVSGTSKKNTTESKTNAVKTSANKVTTTKKTVNTSSVSAVTAAPKNTCTISINCSKINMDKLKSGKESFVPKNGIILKTTTVEFKQGETVFDVLKRVCASGRCGDNCVYCQKSGIQLECSYSPSYGSYYVEGIHQIYEKDCGTKSGWMYKVNGVFPNYSCSQYTVSDGDVIEWVYTCNLGEDVGNAY